MEASTNTNEWMQYVWLATPTVITLIAICGALVQFGRWSGKVNEFMDHTRHNIDVLFIQLFGRLDGTIERASPMRLTDRGRKISDELGIKAWAKKRAPKLYPSVIGWEEYRVYQYANGYVSSHFDINKYPEEEDEIKRIAYEYGVTRESVISVYVIELRDSLLELGKPLVEGSDD